MKCMIDMFSGLGGASEAFIDREDWRVLRFDNNPLLKDVKDTIICDDMFLLIPGVPGEIDLLWASPPCREFSHGFNSPVSKMRRGEEGYENFIPSRSNPDKLIRCSITFFPSTGNRGIVLPHTYER